MTAAAASTGIVEVVGALQDARERTLQLVAALSPEERERSHSELMSPLVWDLAHIAAYEDLWIANRLGDQPLLRPELAEIYDAFETPRAVRGEIPLLRDGEAQEYMAQVRERTLALVGERGVGDGLLLELVLRHEQQHGETMLQTIALARLPALDPEQAERDGDGPRARAPAPTGLEMIEVPAGPCTLGAPARGFAYDNERPRHRTDVRGYLIGRTPITNATYLTFVEGGGYERREWWSDEGWAWKEEYDIGRPMGWTEDLRSEWRVGRPEPLHPHRPVIHVSWFEADAFARAQGARLPTEAEWEKAATWDQERGEARVNPWGDDPLQPGHHANVDRVRCGPAPVDAHPAGASPYGCLAMVGDVWEWTQSEFDGYPGFVAHPYREYSEVFFRRGYRVLRGSSWASCARCASATFRNWDLPGRRQIFAGLRLARDV